MCRCDTNVRFRTASARRIRTLGRISVLATAVVACCQAQTGVAPAVAQGNTAWKRIAGTTINAGLAGPASGAVVAIWYEGSGRLLAETESSRIFETTDFVHWRLNTLAVAPQAPIAAASPALLPEAGAK